MVEVDTCPYNPPPTSHVDGRDPLHLTTQNTAVKEQINPLEFTSAKPAWSSIQKKVMPI